ncbi:MAG TPA: hypothetical protein VLY03_01795 [Bacteroidota bacterium]|nr:hypothetical protein [Bacteroidota bacterium]
MNHLSMAQLFECADGTGSDTVSRHLNACEECRARLRAVIVTEREIRTLPHEHPSEQFTRRVMERLGIKGSSSLAWTVFRNLGPLVAMSAVTGIVFVVLKRTGVLGGSDIGESMSATGKLADSVTHQLSGGAATLSMWLQNLLPSGFGGSSLTVAIFLLLSLAAVGVLDRFIVSPIWRKRIEQG